MLVSLGVGSYSVIVVEGMYLKKFIPHNFSIFSFFFYAFHILEHYAFDELFSCAGAFGWAQE